jgi:hypothetical protein
MTELEQLTQLCERLGAPHAQAAVMAAQLARRATQLATERGVTREAAMARLLEAVVKGRAGEGPAGTGPMTPPPAPPPAPLL